MYSLTRNRPFIMRVPDLLTVKGFRRSLGQLSPLQPRPRCPRVTQMSSLADWEFLREQAQVTPISQHSGLCQILNYMDSGFPKNSLWVVLMNPHQSAMSPWFIWVGVLMTPCRELPTHLALGSAYSAKTPYSALWSGAWLALFEMAILS